MTSKLVSFNSALPLFAFASSSLLSSKMILTEARCELVISPLVHDWESSLSRSLSSSSKCFARRLFAVALSLSRSLRSRSKRALLFSRRLGRSLVHSIWLVDNRGLRFYADACSLYGFKTRSSTITGRFERLSGLMMLLLARLSDFANLLNAIIY